jgi:hypothetical protein
MVSSLDDRLTSSLFSFDEWMKVVPQFGDTPEESFIQ